MHEKEFNAISNYTADNKKFNKDLSHSKLIILGEEHVNPIQRNYADYLDQILDQNNKVDCLFLEWNPDNPEAQKLFKGKKSFSLQYDQHLELVQLILGSEIE